MNIGQYIFNFLFWGFSLCSILYILAWGIVGGIVGVTWIKRKFNKTQITSTTTNGAN